MFELMLELIIALSVFCIFWTFAGYPLALPILSKLINSKKHIASDSFLPTVTLMIMTYNEAKTINAKIRNSLAIDYPYDKIEIMVVDSASTDGTQNIVKKFESIKLLEQDTRNGKASAINFGVGHASGEIIIITDANAMFEKESVLRLVKHFADETVGGVSGRFDAYVSNNTSISRGGSFYWKLEDHMRKWEGNIDSPVTMVGPISAFRKDILDHVDEKNLAEDFDLAVGVRKKGYRIIYDRSAVSSEPAPSVVNDVFIQKKRIVIGTLQTLIKNSSMLFNPKYGWYGTLILPSHKLFQMLSPFFFIALFVSTFGYYSITHSIVAGSILYLQIFGYALSIISGIILHFKPSLTFILFTLFKYVAILQIVVLAGWWDYIKGDYQVTWKKIESSREL